VALKVFDSERAKIKHNSGMKHCKGLGVRAVDFTPEQVRDIIVDALRAAAERIELARRGREMLNGPGDESEHG